MAGSPYMASTRANCDSGLIDITWEGGSKRLETLQAPNPPTSPLYIYDYQLPSNVVSTNLASIRGPNKLQHYHVTSMRLEELKLPVQPPNGMRPTCGAGESAAQEPLKRTRSGAGIGCDRLRADPQKRQ
ncbi:hypothetical protein ETB97_010431 [Aspergillus alliaceus]|uniref:Uncharacterized protein n=1 Tax=Petromyces alliaceus TaxID=209559 RepID=A0A8H6AC81_PETAA|nr:hypothetical protein ETB97_010431 [Aspergillus burnettii]